MGPLTRRSGPHDRPAPHQTPGEESDTPESITREHDYDLMCPDLEGYTSDPLTADEWGAICLAEARDLAEVDQ